MRLLVLDISKVLGVQEEFLDALTLEDEDTVFFKLPGDTNPDTHRHFLGDLNSELHLRSCKGDLL